MRHPGAHRRDTGRGQCTCVYGSGKSTTDHVTIKGQMHQRYARNSVGGGEGRGVKEPGESMYGKGSEAQDQCG